MRRRDLLRPELMAVRPVPVSAWPSIADIPIGAPVLDSDGVVKRCVSPRVINSVTLNYDSNLTSSGGLTWVSEYRIACTATKIRFRLENKTASVITKTDVYCALTNASNFGISSVGNTITGDLSTGWKKVNSPGSSDFVLAPNAFTYSDWVDITPISALDGGNPIILLRIVAVGSGIGYGSGLGYTNAAKTLGGWKSYSMGSFSDAGTNNLSTLVGSGFELFASGLSSTLVVGDSISAGYSNSCTPWAVTTDQNIITSRAVPGYNSLQYLNVLKSEIPIGNYTHVMYPPYTPNDGHSLLTQVAVDTAIARYKEAVQFAKSYGVILIPMVIAPNDYYDLTSDDLRKQLISSALEYYGDDNYLNLITAVNTGASPDRFASADIKYDNMHPNATGYGLIRDQYISLKNVFANNVLIPVN